MVSNLRLAGRGERSFRYDPRMRQALARLGSADRDVSSEGPAGTSLYWLLRSRRPRLAALAGRLAEADLLVVACALADCRAKLIVEAGDHGAISAALAPAGLDWIVRSGDCLPCLSQVRPYDCLILADEAGSLDAWGRRLGVDALLIGLSRRASAADGLAGRIVASRLAVDVSRLSDGRRQLMIAERGAG